METWRKGWKDGWPGKVTTLLICLDESLISSHRFFFCITSPGFTSWQRPKSSTKMNDEAPQHDARAAIQQDIINTSAVMFRDGNDLIHLIKSHKLFPPKIKQLWSFLEERSEVLTKVYRCTFLGIKKRLYFDSPSLCRMTCCCLLIGPLPTERSVQPRPPSNRQCPWPENHRRSQTIRDQQLMSVQEIHPFNQPTSAPLHVCFVGLYIRSWLILRLWEMKAICPTDVRGVASCPWGGAWLWSALCHQCVITSPEAGMETFLWAFSHLTGNNLAGVLVPCVSNLKQAFSVGDNLSGAAQVPQRRLHWPRFLWFQGDEQHSAV